ncbi:hypothetical protein [Rhodococcus rhodochrous]|uniref:hypothetical protein n=1 Tax=Rhodococcus rhodochrous TaxID=1829 RepID=UPI00035C991C|nr:hypothetical protein [Rhodococcus rhodochrous]
MSMKLSIVPEREVKDPRPLLYFFPNLPAQRYAQLIANFHNDEKLKMAEQIAQVMGGLLVPSCCLHWKFKKRNADRKVQIGYQTYYAVKRDEITANAYQKYLDYVAEIQSGGEAAGSVESVVS